MFTGLKDRNHLMKAQTMGVKEYLVNSEYTLQDLLAQVHKYVQPAPQTPPPPADAPAAAPVAG